MIVRYATADDGVKEEEFDMVVLSIGLNPPAASKELSEKFGIELNSHGFNKTIDSNPQESRSDKLLYNTSSKLFK